MGDCLFRDACPRETSFHLRLVAYSYTLELYIFLLMATWGLTQQALLSPGASLPSEQPHRWNYLCGSGLLVADPWCCGDDELLRA